ncbi:MAG: hypothetical protein ACRD1V_06900, partial [Vicinamibacterales bacterium]
VFFSLFLAFGFSLVPVIVKVVLGAQVAFGNQDVPVVAAALRRQHLIIWALWALMGAGTLIAVPAAIAGGMFGDGPARAVQRLFDGPRLGTLAARPGMTVAAMVAASTIPIDVANASTAMSGQGLFEFRIPDTAVVFPGARYYYVTTQSADATTVRVINVGTSRQKGSVAEIDAEDAALRTTLTADGWLAGHEVYRDAQDRALHHGATEGPEGRLWLKDEMVLSINRKRMDEEQPGEDPATAGEWIQYVDLSSRADYPNIDRYMFQPAGRGVPR